MHDPERVEELLAVCREARRNYEQTMAAARVARHQARELEDQQNESAERLRAADKALTEYLVNTP